MLLIEAVPAEVLYWAAICLSSMALGELLSLYQVPELGSSTPTVTTRMPSTASVLQCCLASAQQTISLHIINAEGVRSHDGAVITNTD